MKVIKDKILQPWQTYKNVRFVRCYNDGAYLNKCIWESGMWQSGGWDEFEVWYTLKSWLNPTLSKYGSYKYGIYYIDGKPKTGFWDIKNWRPENIINDLRRKK